MKTMFAVHLADGQQLFVLADSMIEALSKSQSYSQSEVVGVQKVAFAEADGIYKPF